MRYKKLTEEQILISLDRLTRFKQTKEKYFRVFSDILLNNLIEPKYKKSDIENLPFEELRDIAVEIFNSSISNESEAEPKTSSRDIEVNLVIKEYENSIFYNDDETQILLENNLDYKNAIKYVKDDSPVNLLWLRSLRESKNSKETREKHNLKFPIEKVILVEGLTEEVLLPAFSRYLGFDFYQKGVQIIPAGGKNQVVKMYYKLLEELKLPIFLLLDKDAEENISQIKPKLRKIDKIHLVSCGEFEDLLPKPLIIKTVNSLFKNFLTINEQDFDSNLSNAKILEDIFKTKGLHEFKKAEFAKLVRENIEADSDVSAEIKEIIQEIFNINKSLDSKICS